MIGAGPHGLAAAAHLRRAGAEVHVQQGGDQHRRVVAQGGDTDRAVGLAAITGDPLDFRGDFYTALRNNLIFDNRARGIVCYGDADGVPSAGGLATVHDISEGGLAVDEQVAGVGIQEHQVGGEHQRGDEQGEGDQRHQRARRLPHRQSAGARADRYAAV